MCLLGLTVFFPALDTELRRDARSSNFVKTGRWAGGGGQHTWREWQTTRMEKI